jgi:hypothetical protein
VTDGTVATDIDTSMTIVVSDAIATDTTTDTATVDQRESIEFSISDNDSNNVSLDLTSIELNMPISLTQGNKGGLTLGTGPSDINLSLDQFAQGINRELSQTARSHSDNYSFDIHSSQNIPQSFSTEVRKNNSPQPPVHSVELFKTLDIDKSGTLQINEIQSQFKNRSIETFDTDNNGIIDQDELRKMLKAFEDAETPLTNGTYHILERAQEFSTAFQSPVHRALNEVIRF